MKRVKWLFGYMWTGIAIVTALVTFLGYDYFSRMFVDITGVTINPRYSGGEVIKTVDHGDYKSAMHRPVFDSLLWQSKQGFIQTNWEPAAYLPPIIHEGFDYDNDGKEDFSIVLNTVTGDVTLKPANSSVISAEKACKLRNGWAVRVLLRRHS
jgi:hypothetical protein